MKTTSLLKSDLSPSLLNSDSRLTVMARASGWIKRKARKIHPLPFVRGILLAASEGNASFRLLATSIGLHTDDTIAKSSLWGRFNPQAVVFFRMVLTELLATRVAALDRSLPGLVGISRILVQDSTLINLHKRLAESFPATSNQHGLVGAGLRLQAIFELVSGQVLELALTPYLRQDQSATADILRFVKKGDLVIRDLGYLVAASLSEIVRLGGHYLSRYRSDLSLSRLPEQGGAPMVLLDELLRHAPLAGQCYDREVVIGKGDKCLKTRLVARRLPDAVVNARLRKAHLEEKRRGKAFSKRHLALLGWEIYLTSLTEEQASVEKIAAIYRLRWRIEIIFKALKSHTPGMKLASHCSNKNHIQVLVIAWLCLVVMAVRTGSFALASPSAKGEEMKPNLLSLLKVVGKVFSLIASSDERQRTEHGDTNGALEAPVCPPRPLRNEEKTLQHG